MPPAHFIPPHSIEDDDFPPDPVEHPYDPPKVPEPPNYPSMEAPDTDTDQEDEDEERVEDEPSLEEFMDWEYLNQGKLFLLCILSYHC